MCRCIPPPAACHDYLERAGHGNDEAGALFRSASHNARGSGKAITPDGIYKLYSGKLGFEIGAHSLRATAATNALDHQADIAKVQEWLGHANILHSDEGKTIIDKIYRFLWRRITGSNFRNFVQAENGPIH